MGHRFAINRQQFAFFICCVLMVALIYSKFALSVCMIALMAISVFQLDTSPRLRFGFNPQLKTNLARVWRYRPYIILSIFFLLVLVSGLYSNDWTYWTERLRIKLPFLLLPFAFASIPAFSQRQYHSLFYILLLIVTFSCITVGINYWLHFEEINMLMRQGRPIPTPMNHIRFSLLVAFAVVAGIVLWWRKFYWRFKNERWLIGGLTLFLFTFMHVLSVRSGLLVLYLSIGFLCLRFIYRTRRYVLGTVVLAVMLALPILAYRYIPSFQAKVDYARYDLQQYLANNSRNYSDAERLISIKVGLDLGKAAPWLGVGAGDLKREVYAVYAQEYPDLSHPKMPHNQYVSVFAGTGFVGLALFLFALFYPLWYQGNYRHDLFVVFHLIIFFSFMMENTIENAIGVAFYTYFLLLNLNYFSGLRKDR